MGKRVVISNVYSDDNRGGAAITGATIQAVREAVPGCDLSLVTLTQQTAKLPATHRHTAERFPDVELLPAIVPVPSGRLAGVRAVLGSMALLWRARRSDHPGVQRIREASLVVGKGGQVFSGARGWRELSGFWLVLFPLMLARRLRVPTALYSVTIGPYPTATAARALAAWVLRRVDLVLPRDRGSYEQTLALGVPEDRVLQVPDSVFSLAPPSEQAIRQTVERLGLDDVPYGAVTVTTARGADAHELLALLENTLRALLSRCVVERIVVVLQTDGRTSDRPESEELVARMVDAPVTLVDDDLPPEDLMALYGGASFTLGCRIHSTIFSVVAGTPAFGFTRALNVKAHAIFDTVGLGGYVLPLGTPRSGWPDHAPSLAEAIEKSVARGAEERREVRAAVDGQAAAYRRGVQALGRVAQ